MGEFQIQKAGIFANAYEIAKRKFSRDKEKCAEFLMRILEYQFEGIEPVFTNDDEEDLWLGLLPNIDNDLNAKLTGLKGRQARAEKSCAKKETLAGDFETSKDPYNPPKDPYNPHCKVKKTLITNENANENENENENANENENENERARAREHTPPQELKTPFSRQDCNEAWTRFLEVRAQVREYKKKPPDTPFDIGILLKNLRDAAFDKIAGAVDEEKALALLSHNIAGGYVNGFYPDAIERPKPKPDPQKPKWRQERDGADAERESASLKNTQKILADEAKIRANLADFERRKAEGRLTDDEAAAEIEADAALAKIKAKNPRLAAFCDGAPLSSAFAGMAKERASPSRTSQNPLMREAAYG